MSAFKNVSSDFLQAIEDGRAPVAFAYFETAMGVYIYGERSPEISQLPPTADVPILDGSIILDGSTILGTSATVVDTGAYLVEYPDEITQSISPNGIDLISGLQESELTEFDIVLANVDKHMSSITHNDEFLNQECWLFYGFAGLVYADFVEIVRGRVQGYEHSQEETSFRVLK